MLCVFQISLLSLLIFVVVQVSSQDYEDPCNTKDKILFRQEFKDQVDISHFKCCDINLTEKLIESAFNEREIIESEKEIVRVKQLRTNRCGLSDDLTVKRILEIIKLQNMTISLRFLVLQSPIQAKQLEGVNGLNEIHIEAPQLNFNLDTFASLPNLKSFRIVCFRIENTKKLYVLNELEQQRRSTFTVGAKVGAIELGK